MYSIINQKEKLNYFLDTIIIIGKVIGAILFFTGFLCCIFGFRNIGISANSGASTYQSSIGNVEKGSCFSKFTSLAMKGWFNAMMIIGILIFIILEIFDQIISEWFQDIVDLFLNYFNCFKITIDIIRDIVFRIPLGKI